MEVDEPEDDAPVAGVGDKRSAPGATSARTTRASQAARDAGQVELNAELEMQLCRCMNDMLLAQPYVDEWALSGVQRWLQTNKDLAVPLDLLEKYFDRVDQRLTAEVPFVLYDVAEKTVHRDY